jgi:hypothetical protein
VNKYKRKRVYSLEGRKEMTCQNCIDTINKVLYGDEQRRLIYFSVGEADMVMIGCEKHTEIALKRYRLGMDLGRQHGGEEKK